MFHAFLFPSVRNVSSPFFDTVKDFISSCMALQSVTGQKQDQRQLEQEKTEGQ